MEPLVPVTVRLCVPRVIVGPAVMVKVDEACPFGGGVTSTWSSVAVIPEGAPETLRETSELKLFIEATVIVDVV